jgi:aspartyl protease family protein
MPENGNGFHGDPAMGNPEMRNILVGLVLLLPALAGAAEINVVGLMAGRAIVIINQGKPQTLTVGQTTADGIKLVDATSESAIFEVGGKRQTLTLGQGISSGGGPISAQRATLQAGSGGHFVTTVVVNGVSLRFLVDTGATLVTLSGANARRAGINYLAGQKALMQTANGTTTAYRVKLDTVRLGDITLSNVDGAVVEGSVMGELGLLGMSFLNRLEMKRDGQTMTLMRRF